MSIDVSCLPWLLQKPHLYFQRQFNDVFLVHAAIKLQRQTNIEGGGCFYNQVEFLILTGKLFPVSCAFVWIDLIPITPLQKNPYESAIIFNHSNFRNLFRQLGTH